VEANAGDSGVLPDAGDSGVASDAGDSGVLPDAGDSGVASDAGDSGVLPDAGDSGVLSDAGDSGVASDAGDSGVLSDAGDSGTPKTGEHCPSWPTGSSDWDFTTGCSALDAGEVCAERQLGGGKKPDAPRSPSVVFASGQGANRELATRRRSAQCVLYANARKL
jgi:hypothetical protein